MTQKISNITHYDPKKLYYDPLWPTMTQKNSNMTHYDPLWPKTIYFMIHYDPLWTKKISIMI